jgi:hypothetical protein
MKVEKFIFWINIIFEIREYSVSKILEVEAKENLTKNRKKKHESSDSKLYFSSSHIYLNFIDDYIEWKLR